MKKLVFFTSLFLLILSFATAQDIKIKEVKGVDTEINVTDNENGPVMTFTTKEVQYGTIEQHSEPLREVSFTNTGNEPLVIKNARGSCGCTVPIWPKEPIMPGESAKIEIRYATNRLGKINKTVTITTNEESAKPHVLKVLGKVLEADTESVPASPAGILGGE